MMRQRVKVTSLRVSMQARLEGFSMGRLVPPVVALNEQPVILNFVLSISGSVLGRGMRRNP